MNEMKQHSTHMRGHTRRSSSASSGGLQALLNASLSSISVFDDDEEDFFGEFNDSSPPLTGRGIHDHHRLTSRDVCDILDEVEAVLSTATGALYDDLLETFLEPTPIAPHRAQIVDQVQVTENAWHVEDAYLHVLYPLLSKRKQEDEQEQDNEAMLRRPSKKRIVAATSCTTISNKTSFASSKSTESLKSSVSDDSSSNTSNNANSRFRGYQAEQWSDRYEDLVAFCETHGHCLVPHKMPENPALPQWVKRQRYQYKLLTAGKHSTLTQERVLELESLGFVWDSHAAAWEERLDELRLFKAKHGHTNVPANFRGNPTLAIWIKCQRRQRRLFYKGEPSNINCDRIQKLDDIGFVWNPRKGTQ